ncbi:ankyrin repeat [Fusarium mexicanum]|uniref:Ankyrin repeat n=1 Tax=Fusarium mexicanum TaxID=751941 RepID=A0A8H5MN22_9HYPO|nr:ankyrin repeat [Fusarium mexicanum]
MAGLSCIEQPAEWVSSLVPVLPQYLALTSILSSFVPQLKLKHITYLHLSITGDAPHVASHLIKLGTDLWEPGRGLPDLTPLCLAVAQPQNKALLDAGLRIASGYSLPRTTEYLLARAADPNRLSRFGLAAIHLAAMKKAPWRGFRGVCYLLNRQDDSDTLWESMLTNTLYHLLRYGGDPNLKSAVSRMHLCQHTCWRSADCSHRGARTLHFACSSGNQKLVELLLNNGADPGLYDDEGYLPLFSALSQDHAGISIRLLQDHVKPGHLLVIQTSQSTALHVACRFASPQVVEVLLERSADPNISDSHGNTPLHEAVYQNCSELEDRIIQALQLLSDYGASADIESERYETVRDIGKTCLLPRVREIFTAHRLEKPPIPRNRLRAFKLKSSVQKAPSASRVSMQQDNTLLDVDSINPFPSLGNSSKVEGSDEEFNKPQSVWFDNPVIEQLFTAKPSPSSLCDDAARQIPLAGKLESKQKVPEAVENAQGAFLTSSPAKFWGSFSPQTYKGSQTAPESTEGTQSPGHKNQKKKKKWVALDILS